MITIIHFIVITRPEAEHICSFFLSQSVYSMQQARIVPIAFFTTLAQNGNQLGCTSCVLSLYRMQRVPTYEPFDTAQVRPPCLHGRPFPAPRFDLRGVLTPSGESIFCLRASVSLIAVRVAGSSPLRL